MEKMRVEYVSVDRVKVKVGGMERGHGEGCSGRVYVYQKT
jgi:hypothetical protein